MRKLFVFIVIAFMFSYCGKEKNLSSDLLFNALLNEDWEQALNLCNSQYKNSTSVVYLAIKGHVYLANNKNNESLEMFLSLNNPNDKRIWLCWAQQFKKIYPKNAVALYFYGDAAARNGNWQAAIKSYSDANKVATENLTKAIIFNAAGVCDAEIYGKDYSIATHMFELANATDPDFADAYTSLGTMYLKQNAALGAVRYFGTALSKCDDFQLAINGRACSNIEKLDDVSIKLAFRDFMFLLKKSNSPVKKLAAENFILLINPKEKKITDLDTAGMRTRTTEQLANDWAWNDGLKSALDYLPKGQWYDGIKDNTDRNLALQQQELQNRGVFLPKSYEPPGGSETFELKYARIDKGNFKFKSWFGLAQTIN